MIEDDRVRGAKTGNGSMFKNSQENLVEENLVKAQPCNAAIK